MKYLKLDIHYKLPDDFEGDLNDAIENLLNYRRGEKNHKEIFHPDMKQDYYTNWWNMINTTDRVLFGEFSISELDKENNWKDILK